jgi:thiosulfate/3-mercaptopyruvate sulfurtransferase
MMNNERLVDAAWLDAHISDPNVVLIEIDNGVGNYASGHIPGAVKIDWESELLDPVVRDIIDPAAFERLMNKCGVNNDDTVVLYSGQSNWWAAIALWYLTMYGHKDVRILDGGRHKWIIDGRTLSKQATSRPAGKYSAPMLDITSRSYRDDVLAAIGTTAIIDVRNESEYKGDTLAPGAAAAQPHPQRPGHIPTAINIPWTKTVNEDETFKSGEEIAEVYKSHGVDVGSDMIVYCRMGWRSSHSWFALRYLVGAGTVHNYDGSWNEYGMLTGVPIAKGLLGSAK